MIVAVQYKNIVAYLKTGITKYPIKFIERY